MVTWQMIPDVDVRCTNTITYAKSLTPNMSHTEAAGRCWMSNGNPGRSPTQHRKCETGRIQVLQSVAAHGLKGHLRVSPFSNTPTPEGQGAPQVLPSPW